MKSAVSYEEYDKKLIQAIRAGKDTFSVLANFMDEENKKLMQVGDRFRITDRRLQALRRKGFVIFENRRWHVQG